MLAVIIISLIAFYFNPLIYFQLIKIADDLPIFDSILMKLKHKLHYKPFLRTCILRSNSNEDGYFNSKHYMLFFMFLSCQHQPQTDWLQIVKVNNYVIL